jgi:hypothetical protein
MILLLQAKRVKSEDSRTDRLQAFLKRQCIYLHNTVYINF